MDFASLLQGMQGRGAGGSRVEKKPLISFKAGMMNSDPVRGTEKLRIAADARKGTLSVERAADNTVHIFWKDRLSGNLGFDRMVFPNDVTFKRIRTGKEADRVYELKYVGNENMRYFFWMQEPKLEVDTEHAKKFIDCINNPAAAEAAAAAQAGGTTGGAEGGDGNAPDPRMLAALQGMGLDPRMASAMASRRREGGGATGAGTGATPASAAPLDADRLAQVLRSLGLAGEAAPITTPSAPTTSSSSSSTPAAASSSSSSAAPTTSTPAATTSSGSSASSSSSSDDMAGIEDPELAEALRLSMLVEEQAAAAAAASGNGSGSSSSSNETTQVAVPATTSAATVPTTSPAPPPTIGNVSMDDFSRAMQAIAGMGLQGSGGGSSSSGVRVRVTTPIPYVLDPSTLESLLQGDGEDVMKLRAALLPLLPPGQQDMTNLLDILRSPQLYQSMMSMSAALAESTIGSGSGGGGGSGGGAASIIFSNLGLRAADGDAELARGDAVAALVAAVNAEAERKRAAAEKGNGNGEGGK